MPTDQLLEDWRFVLARTGKPRTSSTSSASRRSPSAASMRSSLMQIVKPKPQAIMKITGFNKSAAGVRAHLNYITRHGETLTDQDGNEIDDQAERNEAGEILAMGLPGEQRTTKHKRVAMHLMLAMPHGADPASFELATTDFLRERFGAHEYLYTFHDNTAHYHAHIAIGVEGLDGQKLNSPNKADLHDWREDWAAALERHGIEAQASRAYSRGTAPKNYRNDVKNMEKRGGRKKEPKPSTYDDKAEAEAIEARAQAWERLAAHYATEGDAEAEQAIRGHLAQNFDRQGKAEAQTPQSKRKTEDRER